MEQHNPLVSVGVASYNNAQYIIETLDSIANQTYENIELIIVDDYSSDGSADIIEQWIKKAEISTKFIRNKSNIGVTKVCNIIFSHRHKLSRYLCLSGDDIMHNTRIEMQVKHLISSKREIGAVFSDMRRVDEKLTIMDNSYFNYIGLSYEDVENLVTKKKEQQLLDVINLNYIPAPCIMFKTECLSEIGRWDESLYFEDWDMNLRLIYKGFKFSFLPLTLVDYRVLTNSTFRKPNPRYYDSILKSIIKYKGLTPEIDLALTDKIKQLSLQIFILNGSNSSYWLLQSFKLKKDFKSLGFLLLSILGISYDAFKKFKLKLNYI